VELLTGLSLLLSVIVCLASDEGKTFSPSTIMKEESKLAISEGSDATAAGAVLALFKNENT
jgi:hypothetical protein